MASGGHKERNTKWQSSSTRSWRACNRGSQTNPNFQLLNKPPWITVFTRISAQPRINAYPLSLPLKLKDTLLKTDFLFREYFTETSVALLNLCVLLLPFIALLQIKHTTFAESGENLISAHLELPPTLKVQKFNKRPGRLIE